jgi:hypothetical protein
MDAGSRSKIDSSINNVFHSYPVCGVFSLQYVLGRELETVPLDTKY